MSDARLQRLRQRLGEHRRYWVEDMDREPVPAFISRDDFMALKAGWDFVLDGNLWRDDAYYWRDVPLMVQHLGPGPMSRTPRG